MGGTNSAAFSVTSYKPFGTPVSPSGAEKFEYAGEMIVGAAGSSPGLYYIFARYMDPERGRFVSLDPELGSLSFSQTTNRYVYCVNNPLRFTEPTGALLFILAGIGIVLAGAAIVGGAAGAIFYLFEWWSAGDEPFSLAKLYKRTIEGAVLGVLTVGIDIFARPISSSIGVPIPPGIPGQVVKTIDPWLDKLLGLDREQPLGVRDPMMDLLWGRGPTANEVKDWFKKHFKLPKVGGGPPLPDYGSAFSKLGGQIEHLSCGGLLSAGLVSAGMVKSDESKTFVDCLTSWLPVIRFDF